MKRPGVRAEVARCISIRTEDLWETLELRSLKVGNEWTGGVLEGGTRLGERGDLRRRGRCLLGKHLPGKL